MQYPLLDPVSEHAGKQDREYCGTDQRCNVKKFQHDKTDLSGIHFWVSFLFGKANIAKKTAPVSQYTVRGRKLKLSYIRSPFFIANTLQIVLKSIDFDGKAFYYMERQRRQKQISALLYR